MLRYKAAQVRAVDPKWIYIMDLHPDTEWEDVVLTVEAILEQVDAEHARLIADGIMDVDESEARRWHDVWTGVGEVKGWGSRYRRTSHK